MKRTRPPGPKMDDKSHFLRPQIFGIMKKKLYILCIPQWSQIYFPVELELVSSTYLMKCFLAQRSSRNQHFFLGPTALFTKEGEYTLFWIFNYLLLCLFFLTYFSGPTFIPWPMFIPDSRVWSHLGGNWKSLCRNFGYKFINVLAPLY